MNHRHQCLWPIYTNRFSFGNFHLCYQWWLTFKVGWDRDTHSYKFTSVGLVQNIKFCSSGLFFCGEGFQGIDNNQSILRLLIASKSLILFGKSFVNYYFRVFVVRHGYVLVWLYLHSAPVCYRYREVRNNQWPYLVDGEPGKDEALYHSHDHYMLALWIHLGDSPRCW